MGVFLKSRTRYKEMTEVIEKATRSTKVVERNYMQKCKDNGVLCFLKQKGNVLINNIFNLNYEEITSEQSSLNIYPISMD